MHKLWIYLVASGLLMPATSILAEEDDVGMEPEGAVVKEAVQKEAPAKKEKMRERAHLELQEIVVTGTVTKEEKQNRKGKMVTRYIVTDAAGNKVSLPGGAPAKAGKEGKPAGFNLEEFVDAQVTVTGMGIREDKKGKVTTRLMKITKIDRLAA